MWGKLTKQPTSALSYHDDSAKISVPVTDDTGSTSCTREARGGGSVAMDSAVVEQEARSPSGRFRRPSSSQPGTCSSASLSLVEVPQGSAVLWEFKVLHFMYC